MLKQNNKVDIREAKAHLPQKQLTLSCQIKTMLIRLLFKIAKV